MRLLIRDLQPGQNYKVQLRSTDGTQFSEWSRLFDLTTSSDSIGPAAPTWNTSDSAVPNGWDPVGTSFVASWVKPTLNTDSSSYVDHDHYELQLTDGTKTVTISTPATRYDLSLEANRAFFDVPRATVQARVRAVDTSGNGTYTSYLSATNAVPSTPGSVTTTSLYDSIKVAWASVSDTDLQGYKVYVSTTGVGGSYSQVYDGLSTSYVHNTTLYLTDHYFKVYAYDVFGTLSAAITSGAIRPLSGFAIDSTPPANPTTLTVAESSVIKPGLAVSWNASVDTDVESYMVRWSADATNWNFITIDKDQLGTTIPLPAFPKPTGTNPYPSYYVGIRAKDFSGNVATSWKNASTYPITLTSASVDTTAPSTPNVPTVTSSVQRIQVSHDNKKADGTTDIESDVVAYNVDASTTTGFTPSSTTRLGVLVRGPVVSIGTFNIPASHASASTETWYVKVSAVDGAGNISAYSAQATSTPGLVGDLNVFELSANKLKANTAIINKLIIGTSGADNTGAIESYDYGSSGGTTGFRLVTTGLIIKTGAIEAAALKIQTGSNIAPVDIGDFEFAPSYYTSKFSASGSGVTITVAAENPKYSSQAMKIVNTSGASRQVYLSPNSTTNNINIPDTGDYIASLYARVLSGTLASFNMKFGNTASLATSSSVTLNTTYQRLSIVRTFSESSGRIEVTIPGNATVYIDGVQVEKVIGAITTPSVWTPPSTTSIDGGMIRTGSIQSSQDSSIAGVPMWSINLAGNAVLSDLLIRGNTILGASAETTSTIKSYNYSAGTTGWLIRADGYAEFRQLAANSISIGKFDVNTQNLLSTKFADFMENATLWGRHTTTGTEEENGGTAYSAGTFTGITNTTGAATSKAMLNLTGKTAIRRKSSGLNTGIAFEPGLVYKVTARMRQATGPLINFISNPAAYRATTGAGLADLWISNTFFAGGGTQTATVVSTPTHSGGTAQKMSHASLPSWPNTGNGHSGFEPNPTDGSRKIQVTGGKTYTASCWMNLQAGTTVKGTIVMQTKDSSGATINGFIGGSQDTLTNGTWVRVSNTYTVESNAAELRVLFLALNANTITQTVDVVFDDAMVTQTGSAVTYFDGGSTDCMWTGAANDSPSQQVNTHKFRVGVLGFDTTGALLASDGTTSADPSKHYMVSADGSSNLALWDGTQSESGGWIEVSGYVGGKTPTTATPPGLHPSAYNPAALHENTAYIVPFVQTNIDTAGSTDIGLIAELDMFTIEASNTLAPTKMATATGPVGGSSIEASSYKPVITIEDMDNDDWGVGLRLYSGSASELYPGIITEFADPAVNNVSSLLIAPPVEYSGNKVSYAEGLKIRGRSGNFLYNSSFEHDWIEVSGAANSESQQHTIWKTNGTITQDATIYRDSYGVRSAKIVSAASGISYPYYRVMMYNYPELLDQQTFTLSAWVYSPATNPATINTGVWFKIYDNTDTLIEGQDSITSGGLTVANDAAWHRVSKTFTLTNPISASASYINVGWGFNATAASQILYIDDVQLEMGTLSDYKPQTYTSFRLPGAGTIIGGQLVVSNKLNSINELPYGFWKNGSDYVPANPSIMIEKDGKIGMIERDTVTITAGTSLSRLKIKVVDNTGSVISPAIYISDSGDLVQPNTVQIYNANFQVMAQFGSNLDPTNASANLTAKDLTVQGSFRAAGAPTWTAPTSLGTSVTSYASSQSIATFNSNGITYFRGMIDFTGTVAISAVLMTLPTAHRPVTLQYISAQAFFSTSTTAQIPVTLTVNTSGQVVLAATPSSMTSSNFIPLGGLSFTTSPDGTTNNDDGTNPVTAGAATSPSSVTIAPYSSGVSTGTYKLSWTNANDTDNATVRIVWNANHSPTSSDDGTVVTIPTVNNAAQTYLLSGLPVNRTIYVKLWAVNQNGTVAASGSTGASRYLLSSPTVIYANSTASWRAGLGGVWRSDNDSVYQGEWNSNDDHRGLWFYGTQINDKMNTGSPASVRIPTKILMELHRITASGPDIVTFDMYPHPHSTRPSGVPTVYTSRSEGLDITNLRVNQDAVVQLPAAWYSTLAAGTWKGLAIYHPTGAYGIMSGKSLQTQTGRLTIYHNG